MFFKSFVKILQIGVSVLDKQILQSYKINPLPPKCCKFTTIFFSNPCWVLTLFSFQSWNLRMGYRFSNSNNSIRKPFVVRFTGKGLVRLRRQRVNNLFYFFIDFFCAIWHALLCFLDVLVDFDEHCVLHTSKYYRISLRVWYENHH